MFFPDLLTMLLHALYVSLRVGGSGSFPQPLSAEDERMYLERYAAGDQEARSRLIEHNLRLVAHIIKKYYAASVDQEDLISIGTIGLIKAISTFCPERGTRLATYTARCIENEILMYFRGQKRSLGELSLSDPIDVDREGNTLALMDVISTEDNLAEIVDSKDRIASLYRCIGSVLDERECRIIGMRYGLLGASRPMTQREIAHTCKISRSYVSRLEKKALRKLETAMAELGMEEAED